MLKYRYKKWKLGVSFGAPEISEISGGFSPREREVMQFFFYPSETSKASSHDWWERVKERTVQGKNEGIF